MKEVTTFYESERAKKIINSDFMEDFKYEDFQMMGMSSLLAVNEGLNFTPLFEY